MSAASIRITKMMPHQIGLYPMAVMTGTTTGVVAIIIDSVSMKQPRIR